MWFDHQETGQQKEKWGQELKEVAVKGGLEKGRFSYNRWVSTPLPAMSRDFKIFP